MAALCSVFTALRVALCGDFAVVDVPRDNFFLGLGVNLASGLAVTNVQVAALVLFFC